MGRPPSFPWLKCPILAVAVSAIRWEGLDSLMVAAESRINRQDSRFQIPDKKRDVDRLNIAYEALN
jgi:hypothetical protein